MKKNLLTTALLICALSFFGRHASAQFNSDSSQTYFVCNATGSQIYVSAFGDGNGGTYSFWSDKRNGTAGTAIYGQHMDSLGFPLWPTNGKLFYQENGKEVWNMKAVAWQNGILIAWVQGGFGIGGDTLFCNYYDQNGVSQWTSPTVVANKQSSLSIIYVDFDNLDVYPNDSGATITFGLSPSGGNNYFSFNRIDFSGNLRWPLDSFSYQGNGYYYHTGYDNHNGFYVATSTGGLGTHIYMGHFDFQGNLTIPTPVDISTVVGGRGNSQWKILCDADTNAYIVWGSYTNTNISIAKIRPDGTFPWGGDGTKPICMAAGYQDLPDFILKGNDIYAIWDDGRPGSTGNSDIYMQKLDTAGNPQWTVDGILVSHLSSYIPYPNLTASGNNVVATYVVNGDYYAQQIRPDSSFVWNQNGIVINTPNPPFYGDQVLVSSPDGSVTSIWRESGDNICAARIRPNGILTRIGETKGKSIRMFPNPAQDELFISGNNFNGNDITFKIYDSTGRQVNFSSEKNTTDQFSKTISLKDFSGGVYTMQIQSAGFTEIKKFIVVK